MHSYQYSSWKERDEGERENNREKVERWTNWKKRGYWRDKVRMRERERWEGYVPSTTCNSEKKSKFSSISEDFALELLKHFGRNVSSLPHA